MARERNRERSAPKKDVAAEKETKAKKGKEKSGGSGSELQTTIDAIKKRMGDHAVSYSSNLGAAATTFIETGVFTIDYGLLGGVPEGRVTMVYGHEACGKSTLIMRLVAAAQRKHPGKVAVIVDAEGTIDMVWAAAQGVDVDKLLLVKPDSGEECVDAVEAFLRTMEICFVAIDSLPAIVPQAIIERSAEDPTMAQGARLIGVLCSKIIAAFQHERGRGHNPTVVMVNQWRSKVGFVLGNPNTLPGGKQPKYLSSVMLEMKKKKEHIGKDKYENDTTIYNEHAFDIDKSKTGSSIRQGEFKLVTSSDYNMQDADADAPDIFLPAGSIDDYKVVAAYGKRMGFITGGAASWQIDGVDGKFRNVAAIMQFLVENPDEFVSLKRKMIGLKRKENGLPPIPYDNYLLGWVGKRK